MYRTGSYMKLRGLIEDGALMIALMVVQVVMAILGLFGAIKDLWIIFFPMLVGVGYVVVRILIRYIAIIVGVIRTAIDSINKEE